MKDKRIRLDVSEDAKMWLAKRGYDPAYGARPLNRLIQKRLLNPLASEIIKNEVRDGDIVHVGVNDAQDGLTLVPEHEALPSNEEEEK